MKILIPGGAGYVGAVLVPHLLAAGHRVTVFDPMWFGHGHLPDNENVTVIKGDVRDIRGIRDACVGQDAVIYLASLSNNAMCEREPRLHDMVNLNAVPIALFAARIAGVKRFIYASSVAAYGSSDEAATEARALEPTTAYGKGKAFGEEWTQHYNDDDFTTVITRSASVCGYSQNQRFDLTVNMMVRDAAHLGVITVNGGKQKRSHIHIQDVCAAYKLLLDAPAEKVSGQAFNLVASNASVMESADSVAHAFDVAINVRPRSDDRSYTVDGTKAREVLGFTPKRTVEDAITDLKARFDSGQWPDAMTNPAYMNMADVLH